MHKPNQIRYVTLHADAGVWRRRNQGSDHAVEAKKFTQKSSRKIS